MILFLAGCGGGGGGGGTSSTVAQESTTTPTLTSIEVTQTNPSIALGYDQKFIATGIYLDNTKQDITTSVYWSSSQSDIATISNAAGTNGIATARNTGSTIITATFENITGTTTLTVTPAVLESISIIPTNSNIALGTTKQLAATGTFSDTTTQNLTAFVTWSSSATGTATISNASGSNGLATSVAVGATSITATDPTSGIYGTTVLNVTAATLASIDITPTNPSIANGLTEQFTATGIYTDRTTQDLTAFVTWSSSATGTATISNASGSNGLATSVAVGATTITATDPT
ncbi:MAG: Ig-like domain-containing protein, partial [Syntrophaceae bacterium]